MCCAGAFLKRIAMRYKVRKITKFTVMLKIFLALKVTASVTRRHNVEARHQHLINYR